MCRLPLAGQQLSRRLSRSRTDPAEEVAQVHKGSMPSCLQVATRLLNTAAALPPSSGMPEACLILRIELFDQGLNPFSKVLVFLRVVWFRKNEPVHAGLVLLTFRDVRTRWRPSKNIAAMGEGFANYWHEVLPKSI